MKTNAPKPFIVVDSISQITRKLQSSKLESQNLTGIKRAVKGLALYLGVTEQQAMLFAVFFIFQIRKYSVDIHDIVNYLDLELADSILLKIDIDLLLDKGLIEAEFEPRRQKSRRQRMGQSGYVIPGHVSEAIYSNSPIEYSTEEKLDIFKFTSKVSDYIDQREEEQDRKSVV